MVEADAVLVDTMADLNLAHTMIRDTTAGTKQTDLDWAALDRLHPQIMAMDRRRRVTMDDRSLRNSQDRRPRPRPHPQETRMTAKRCGDCLVPWTKTVCHDP
jgi:hypothetical protein